MERIESVNNKTIKLTASLLKKKFRAEYGLFIAEGERLVLDAIKLCEPQYIIVSQNFHKKDFPYKTYEVPETVFEKLSDTVTPQGILAVFKTNIKKLSDITPGDTIILNKLQDPGNLGTILRTAVATGIKNIVLDKNCVDIYNSKTVRSSMSAIFNLNIYISEDLENDIDFLKNNGFQVFCTALTKESKSLYSTSFLSPSAFVIGNEANGADPEIIDKCNEKIIIPMENKIESLNASVAGSIVMYEIYRRKKYEG